MSKHSPIRPTRRTRSAAAASSQPDRPDFDFEPVALRERHDGWLPDKQTGLIEALAECGCVVEACERIGMSPSSAYALRRRADAQSFRLAWDAALDYAIHRLSEAAFARALKGIARPIFFQGEQIGERRYYDERLTMFLLRYRDPLRYGAWLDGMRFERHPDGPAIMLNRMVNRVEEDAFADAFGDPRPRHAPPPFPRVVDPEEEQAESAERHEARMRAIHEVEYRRTLRGHGETQSDAEFEAELEALDEAGGSKARGSKVGGT